MVTALPHPPIFRNCQLCPRDCRADRTAAAPPQPGYCGESAQLRVAAIEAHFGEEPPISGTCGSGTVFFSGCSLKCIYCQNYQISHLHLGKYRTVAQVVAQIERLVQDRHIHNVNFVTPDHFFPQTIAIVNSLHRQGISLPIVYNLSGYQRIESLRLIAPVATIYLPDFKYSDAALAKRLSNASDYPAMALKAIAEMVRQQGFLDSFDAGDAAAAIIATHGVLVRHLILPGQIKNSIDALTTLFTEFGRALPLSLMSQYYPVRRYRLTFLNRTGTEEEFQAVYQHALALGFNNMFVQFPDSAASERPFLPDFTRSHPFAGNVK